MSIQPSFCFSCSSTPLLTHVQLVVPFLLMCYPDSNYSSVSAYLAFVPIAKCFVSFCFCNIIPIWQVFLHSNLALLPILVSFANLIQYFILSSGHLLKCCIVVDLVCAPAKPYSTYPLILQMIWFTRSFVPIEYSFHLDCAS